MYVVLNFKYQAEKFEVVVITVEINCSYQGHYLLGVFLDSSCDDCTVQNDVTISPEFSVMGMSEEYRAL